MQTLDKTILNNVFVTMDFISLEQEDFMNKYSYFNTLDYNIAHDIFYSDKKKNILVLYKEVLKMNYSIKADFIRKIKQFCKKYSLDIQV